MVFYTWGKESLGPKYDPDFGKEIEWDIPLLEGYNYTFLQNTSKDPGSHHFKGIINPSLNKEIEAWGPDVVWVWGWAFDSHLKAMRYFKGKVSVWFRGDSTLLDESPGFALKKIARRLFLTWVYSYIDKAFYVGTHNNAYFKAHGLKDSQLVYAPHAIDNERFTEEKYEYQTAINELRINFNIHESSIVFLFAGKFEPKKNPFFMVQLANHLRSDQYKFIFVGNGKLENELKRTSISDRRIVFMEFQNQTMMPILYRLSSFYVLPSIGPGETWGLAINESLASGTPVIASEKCGGTLDLINSTNGYVLKLQSHDFKHIETWVKSFIQDQSRMKCNNFLELYCYQNIIKAVINNF